MAEKLTKWLWLWIHTIPADSEQIPPQASSDSLGWISTDGQIELCRGRALVGAEETANGYVKGEHFWYKADWTAVHFRKINTKIQYLNGSTWTDIVTGLTSTAEYTFSNYQSLAGTFVFATWADGIYKIHTANPWSYTSLYDSSKNFKGKSMIATARMIMWDLANDKTGLYGSYVDEANYTTVTTEALADTASGTLAFKWGGATRTCFGVIITDTSTWEVFTDNYNGVLTGSLGGTGTINYTTGAYTTSQSWGGTADYQWENSNNNGITDFTKSAPRLAGEGFLFRQDEGGDPILNVTYVDGSYYSIKSRSVYKLTIWADDTTANNNVFRTNLGMPSWRATVSTGQGIFFINTANADTQLTILTPNQLGDNLYPKNLAEQFDFSQYIWDNCCMGTFGEYIIFSGKSFWADSNDRLFLYNFRRGTVDILGYSARTIVENNGHLYIGDSTTDNVYEILSGFDDDDQTIENYWMSGDELFGTQNLKKVKRFRIKGIITPEQQIQIYSAPDNSEYTLLGTIRGDGTYVDYDESYTIGANGIGTAVIWGENDNTLGSTYFAEIKISQGKFRKRNIKLIATGIGYVSVNMYEDVRIQQFRNRLPSKYRSKQNVSKDWTETNLPNPE